MEEPELDLGHPWVPSGPASLLRWGSGAPAGAEEIRDGAAPSVSSGSWWWISHGHEGSIHADSSARDSGKCPIISST